MGFIYWLAISLALSVNAGNASLSTQEQQATAAAPASTQEPTGVKVWVGRYGEFEEFISSAKIVRTKDVGTGVTHPKHAYFEPGGLAEGAAVKPLPPKRQQGYFESYKSEIAAYKVDRLLDMDMVPPTVERKVDGDMASVQLWVENTRMLKEVDQKKEHAPNVLKWNRQVYRQRAFDALIGNIDENATNILIDKDWTMVLIDHSRAFTNTTQIVFEKELTFIDRPFFDKMKALTEADLQREIGSLLEPGTLGPMLKRRDQIVQIFEKRAAEKGEAQVFLR